MQILCLIGIKKNSLNIICLENFFEENFTMKNKLNYVENDFDYVQ
ncbi:unknown [Clostridium sp. CAG:793]|nr:unknown [Clostridium sp. CAG:793]